MMNPRDEAGNADEEKGYVREMTVKKSFMANMDHLSICSSFCLFVFFLICVEVVCLWNIHGTVKYMQVHEQKKTW